MEGLLNGLLNMSVTASYIVLIILVARLLMRKLPKGFSYALWFIVLFRFLCPISIPSPISMLPLQSQPVLQEIINASLPGIPEEIEALTMELTENPLTTNNLPAAAPEQPVKSSFNIPFLLTALWIAGIVFLLGYGLLSCYQLRQRLRTAIRIEKNIYESEQLTGAFVIGILRPVIYLPTGLSSESRRFILCHEQAHISRRDYLVKLIGLLMITIHWFNPLAWLSFHLLCKDMEMACDERVIKSLGMTEKKSYSLALLQAAEEGSGLLVLAFGESNTKLRIKNILNYRRPRFWVSIILALVLLVTGVSLITNPQESEPAPTEVITIIDGDDGPTSVFIAGKVNEDEENQESDTYLIPNEEWLANTYFKVGPSQGQSDNEISLDLATENRVIFHGDFGLFSFENENGYWQRKAYIRAEDMEGILRILDELDETDIWSAEGISWERDRMRAPEYDPNAVEEPWTDAWDFAARKMHNGKIAALGGYAEDGIARLIDLSYGYYSPEDQIFHQVYLFTGDGMMFENEMGKVSRQKY